MQTGKLAIHGAPPELPEGPPAWPPQDPGVLRALEEAFQSGTWGKYDGPLGRELVERLGALHGTPHVLTCCSGTFAVELALRALRIGPGDEVLLAGYDFSGNFRGVEAVGARPILVEIDPRTWCIDVNRLEDAIGADVRALVVSHLHGGLAPMAEICELAERRGLRVIEDACQAPAALVQNRMAGTWGDVGVLSFGGSKLLSAGRGGALLTRQADAFQRARIYCERGNNAFPLSELQAAALLPQLELLPQRNRKRRASVELLLRLCCDLPSLLPLQTASELGQASFYKLAWLYQAEAMSGRTREEFVLAAQAEGVHLDVGFRGFTHRSTRRCRRASSLKHCDAASQSTVLLHHPVLLQSLDTIQRVARALVKVTRGLSSAK
jgi:dTDP-4-amino-4,6-dideoxygalactose transaminase